MREIKFRAWDKLSKIFFTNDEIVIRQGKCIELFDNEWFKNDYPEYLILMQYTGLKDKNGVEIYESDLCLCHDGLMRVVEANIEETGFKLRHPVGTEYCEPMYFGDGELEVKGNIYEQ